MASLGHSALIVSQILTTFTPQLTHEGEIWGVYYECYIFWHRHMFGISHYSAAFDFILLRKSSQSIECYPRIKKVLTAALSPLVAYEVAMLTIFGCGLVQVNLPIYFRVTSLVLG